MSVNEEEETACLGLEACLAERGTEATVNTPANVNVSNGWILPRVEAMDANG